MASGLSRVTIVAPRSRVDLALPSDVPLADLLPTVLRHAGPDLADEAAAQGGWTLARLGGPALDSARTPAQLEVRDGELLYLRPHGDEVPPPVFDDVVDAVATGTRDRAGRWTPASTRVFGLALGATALLAGAVAVLFAGPPQTAGGLVALGIAVALLVTAVLLARALGDTRGATVVALVATAYAGLGGLLVLAGDRRLGELTAAHLLVAATAVVLATAAASIGVGDAGPVLLCAAVSAGALFIATVTALLLEIGPAAAAAVTVTAALALLPLLPMTAYRLARLPVPTVPSERDQIRQDAEAVDGAEVLERSGRADAYLAGMLGALAIIGAVSAAVIATDDARGVALCTVLGLLLMARARWFLGRVQRLPLLAAGAVALGAAGVALFGPAGYGVRLAVAVGALVVGALGIGFGLAGARRASPVWGRMLDIFEVLLIVAVVPLAVWVSGLLGWIRALRG